MTITGPGAENLNVRRSPSAATDFRVFVVSTAATQTATIEGMMISRGSVTGGALFKADAGSLVLDSVWLTDNQITGTGSGAGIHCDGGSLSVRNSTLSANQADFAGGISVNSNLGAMTACVANVVNSTITGNSAREFGGGIYVGGTGQITVNSTTVHGNTADSDGVGGGSGGGTYIASAQASITVANTLYAGNKVGTTPPVANQCGGTHTSSGYNLRETNDAACNGFTATGDFFNANATLLGSLGDNGGPTPTIALLPTNPAIDAGNPGTPGGAFPVCPAEDQRGATRGGGNGICDIGAFEWQHPTTTTVACVPTSLTLGVGSTTCTATVTDMAASPVTPTTPTLSVDFTTDGAGTFSNFGICTLTEVILGQASCSVTYTPSAVGTGSHLITGAYGGDVGHDPSQGSAALGVLSPPVTPPVVITPPVATAPPVFNLKAAIKKCRKKFPKGPKRKKCIRRAKRRAGLI